LVLLIILVSILQNSAKLLQIKEFLARFNH
jgi:hypothetical protein